MTRAENTLCLKPEDLLLELDFCSLLRLCVAQPRLFVRANIGNLDPLAKVLENNVLFDGDRGLVLFSLLLEPFGVSRQS